MVFNCVVKKGAILLILFCGLVHTKLSSQQFAFQAEGYDLTLYLTLPSLTPSKQTKFILFLNGFECRAAWYAPYVDALVSEGYAVVQFDKSEFTIIDDVTELSIIDSIFKWLVSDYQKSTGLQLNLNNLAMIGHSRGGKLAALMYARYAQYVSTIYLIDPVDNSKHSPQGENYPSAVLALQGLDKQMGITGAGISGECNPVSADYLKFWQVADQKSSTLQVIEQSGHMQFCKLPFYLRPFFDELCGYGSNSEKETIDLVLEDMIAWIKTHFAEDQQDQTFMVA